MNQDTDVHTRVREQFGTNAEKYITSATHAQGWDLAQLIKWLQPTSTEIALDVATGGGHVAKTLAPHLQTVYVSDLTVQMLSAARKHLSKEGIENAVYIQADAEALPFLNETFDIVTCRIAAHHFPHPDRFISEVARVLKPGGRFVFIDNVAPEQSNLAEFLNLVEFIRDPSHVRCLTVSEWSKLLSEYGLRIQNRQNQRKHFEFRSWVERMAPTAAHIAATEAAFRFSTDEIAKHFEITVNEPTVNEAGVKSWVGDQWMVLAQRET